MKPSENLTEKQQSLSELYQELKKTLVNDEAELEARIILETILKIESKEIIAQPDLAISRNQLKQILEVRDKRNKRIPLAYILEEAHFMDLKLFVNSDVLIPRPETELLVENVLKEIKDRKIHHPVILDLCTGSGCIAVALKKALPAATVYASDISKAALNVASINAQRYNTEIQFIFGDYLDPFTAGLKKKPGLYPQSITLPVMKGKAPFFDVIVSNPPYVSEAEYQELEPELFHEPKHALVGFPYKEISEQVKDFNLLKDNGFLAFEYGQGQAKKLLEIFPKGKIYSDYAGIERMIISDV